jgi:hypothetical protein
LVAHIHYEAFIQRGASSSAHGLFLLMPPSGQCWLLGAAAAAPCSLPFPPPNSISSPLFRRRTLSFSPPGACAATRALLPEEPAPTVWTHQVGDLGKEWCLGFFSSSFTNPYPPSDAIFLYFGKCFRALLPSMARHLLTRHLLPHLRFHAPPPWAPAITRCVGLSTLLIRMPQGADCSNSVALFSSLLWNVVMNCCVYPRNGSVSASALWSLLTVTQLCYLVQLILM